MLPYSLSILAAAGLAASRTATPAGSGCSVLRVPTTQEHSRLLLQGTALTRHGVLRDARILIVNGTIASVLPSHEHSLLADLPNDIDDEGLAVVRCGPDAVISPGFINTHEHIEFSTVRPLADIGERADHRHDWRVGLRGHTARPAPVNQTAGTEQDATRWGELRHLLSGTTSIVGGQMVPGLVRNLDYADGLEEPLWSWLFQCRDGDDSPLVDADLAAQAATWDTFPLGDARGILRVGDCDYSLGMIDAAAVAKMHRYLAHVAEGIDDAARNEFRCLSDPAFDTVPLPPDATPSSIIINNNNNNNKRGNTEHPADMAKANESTVQPPGHLKPPRPITSTPGTSSDILGPNLGLVHALGVPVSDYPLLAARGVSVIWSPRSNIFLYGKTLDVHALLDAGVNVALGTDWLPSGSASMAREAVCARDAASRETASEAAAGVSTGTRRLQARTIWQMMTANAAHVAGVGGKIGALEVGAAADIVIIATSSSHTTPSGDYDDDESYYAKAIYAEPAAIQLVLRGGTPLVIDKSLRDLAAATTTTGVSSAAATATTTTTSPPRCEEVPYSSTVSKILCLGSHHDADLDADTAGGQEQGKTTRSYAQLIRDRAAAGVYPAFYPPGEIPEDEPSCVPTR